MALLAIANYDLTKTHEKISIFEKYSNKYDLQMFSHECWRTYVYCRAHRWFQMLMFFWRSGGEKLECMRFEIIEIDSKSKNIYSQSVLQSINARNKCMKKLTISATVQCTDAYMTVF